MARCVPGPPTARAAVLAAALFCLTTLLTALGVFGPLDRLATLARLHIPAGLAAWVSLPFALAAGPELTALAVAAIALWRWRHDRRAALALIVAFTVVNVVEIALKATLLHPNPPNLRHHAAPAPALSGLVALTLSAPQALLPRAVLLNSFPSGHMARATLLGLVLCARFPGRIAWGAAGFALLVLALVLVLGGAHWPSDVLGGTLLGWAAAAAAHRRPAQQGQRSGHPVLLQ